ncbi:FtsX-like permease family protein [Streptomyces sp. NPDC048255]|uniref:ABC transporter permease n=1 Tax=Streptomyces sp. NPDC048255 TaxID=3154713 RepID=UPI0033C676DD
MLRTALRNLLAHKARLAMTVLTVCLGVAFVCGTLVFADSAAAGYRAAASKSFAGIAVTVTAKESPSGPAAGPRDGVLTDTLVRKLAEVPGVTAVRPTADGSATLAAADGSPLRSGTAWANLAGAYVPGPDGKDSRHPLAEGHAPRNSDEVAVDAATAEAGGFNLGDPISLATNGPVMTKRLVGIVTTHDTRVTAGGTLALFDKATAQQLFAAPGQYTGIDLTAAPGTSQFDLADRVTAVLPADRAEATTASGQADQQAVYVNTLTRGYQKIPTVFAGVSLFIGSFLIINTFTMLVTRRTREIALLRAIGATRRQVVRSLLTEAALLGLAASVIGFLAGLGVASALPHLLSGSGGTLPDSPLVIGARPVVAALAVGVGVTVLAAWLPSRRAARIAPIEAMRSAQQPPSSTSTRVRGLAGAVLMAAGAGLLISLTGAKDASEENLQSAMLGCGVLIAGLIVLAPLLAGPLIRALGTLTTRFGIVGRLAQDNALRDPRRTAATAAALMVSTALVAGLAVIGNSTAQALDRQAAAGLSAHYLISTRTDTDAIDPAAIDRVTGTAGVEAATATADSTLFIGGRVQRITGVEPNALDTAMNLDFVSGSAKDLVPGRIAVSATIAREHGLSTGSRLDARMGASQESRHYTVVGVYQDNPIAQDVLGARTEVQGNSFLPGSAQRVFVRTQQGAAKDLGQRLRTAVGNNPLLKIQDRDQLVAEAGATVSNLLTLMYGLLAIGVVIASLGIANTLAMSVAERTREIGVLRAIGMHRKGIRRMIRLESLTVAAFGTTLGLACGLFGAWAIGSLANGAVEQYSLSLPWGTLLLVCLASLAIGAIAAAVPARRAAALNPLQAITDTP